jgi:hypothetical protein
MCLQLNANEACSPHTGKKPLRVRCRRGALLLTRTGLNQDLILRRGETREVGRGGRVAILALEGVSFTIEPLPGQKKTVQNKTTPRIG